MGSTARSNGPRDAKPELVTRETAVLLARQVWIAGLALCVSGSVERREIPDGRGHALAREPAPRCAASGHQPDGRNQVSLPPSSTLPAFLRNFFPLAVDHQPAASFAAWKADGINTVVRVPWFESIDVWTAAANANELKMIRDARPMPGGDDAETGLLAWLINDEPEEHFLLENMRQRYRELRPFHTRPIFFNFAGLTVWRPIHDKCNGPGDGSNETCYADYIDTEDWVSNDIYPVNSLGGGDNLRLVGATLDKLRRWSGSKVQLAYIETGRQNQSVVRGPTAAEVRGQLWSAIIHGARGILYFPLGDCSTGVCHESNATPPLVQAEMRVQNARVASMASVLQGSINPPPIGIATTAPLEATWRISGTENYFFVLNLSAVPITGAMTLCGATPPRRITVVEEGRTVGSQGSPDFFDRFDPYELHIYRF